MYASSIRIRVSGELCLTRRTNFSMAAALCTVPVGLFGLQKKIIPAPLAASAIASASSPIDLSTVIILTGAPMRRAAWSQVPYVGAAVTSGFWAEQNARVAPSRIGPEPVPTMTWSRPTP